MSLFEFIDNDELDRMQAEAMMLANEAGMFSRCGYTPDELVCGIENQPRGGRFMRTGERFIMPRCMVPESVVESDDGFDWGEDEEDDWDEAQDT